MTAERKGSRVLEVLLLSVGLVRGLFGKKTPPAQRERRTLAELYPEIFPELPAALPAPEPRKPRREFHIREGWSEPKPATLPAPTYTPAGMAFGIVMVAFGLVTKWYLVVVGLIIVAIAVWSWVGELVSD